MNKIFLWGAGEKAEIVYKAINKDNCSILGIIDIDEKKSNQLWMYDEIMIYSPKIIRDYTYDYIVITAIDYTKVKTYIERYGIDSRKIICFWNEMDYNTDVFSYISIIKYIEKQKEIFKCRYLNYGYELHNKRTPKIHNAEILLKRILQKRCSLVRFGDGEWEMIFEKNRPWFQKTDAKLSKRLREIMLSEDKNILVAIADNFSSLDLYTEHAADGIREYMVKSRREIDSLLDYNREYYDAYVTRPYMIYKDKTWATKIFELFKQVFEDRNVIIVEGYNSNIGEGNDLFEKANSIRKILCPQKNAWNKYDEILNSTIRHAKEDDLICVSLGPTATVLAYDIAKSGFQALDIGQIDNEYEWYLRNVQERVDINGKFVAEVQSSCSDESLQRIEQLHDKSIIAVIE